MTWDPRTYQRLYARRRRERELQSLRLRATMCPKRWGKYPCGGPLETRIDRVIGKTLVVCLWCERHARGLCQDCPKPVIGRARRCPNCKIEEARRARARYVARHHDVILARLKTHYWNDPGIRERRIAYKRLWRKANAEKVKAQKRRESLRQPLRSRQYMARYRARYREHYRQLELARYYRLHPRRPDPHCATCGARIPWDGRGRPMKRCDACVFPCVRRRREAARPRRAAPMTENPAPVPRIRYPRSTYALADGTHRCVSPGCEAVLEGRQKKCDRCKERDETEATLVLRTLRPRAAA